MSLLESGAAFVDRSGALVVADEGFLARLGLAAEDPAGALRALAEASPALLALLAGEGPATARVEGASGAVELRRVSSEAGALLLARGAAGAEQLEDAIRSPGLARVAGGAAHEIRNQLNTISLQLALVEAKLSPTPEALAAAGRHLATLKEQVPKVNELLRRLVDVAEPDAQQGYTDLGALVADAGSLLGYDARRRNVDLVVEAKEGVARTSRDPARVGRIVVGLLAGALAETPGGGRLVARVATRGPFATIDIEHAAGDPDLDLGYYSEVVAAAAEALGGELGRERRDGVLRLSLALPRDERE